MRIRSEVAKAGLDVTARNNRPLIRRSTNAKLRQAATIENVGYRTACGLDRPLFQTLAIGEGSDHNHLMIVGPNGTGKSWLACGPATKRAVDGFSVSHHGLGAGNQTA
ncbi:DNA replication protein DnaC [Bradyrhizobium sp. GM7.3]